MPIRRDLDDSGAALVEAALVLPVLLVLVFGIADFALYLWQLNSAQKAVHLGVRAAIVSAPVAIGAGLTPAESATYWNGLPMGASCAPDAGGRSVCPVFSVRCSMHDRCTCTGQSGCDFTFAEARTAPVIGAMRAVLPNLKSDQVRVTYTMNYLGYVGRPIPVPVDVTVEIIGFRYEPLFLAALLGPSLAIRASATLPGENLGTDDDDDRIAR